MVLLTQAEVHFLFELFETAGELFDGERRNE